MVIARANEEERREREKKAASVAKAHKFREDLENQMRENAARKRVMPMTETEKMINTQLLGKVSEFRLTGKVDV